MADTYAASPGHCDTVVAAYPYSRFGYAYCYAVVVTSLPDSDALANSHCYSDALAYQHTHADAYGDTYAIAHAERADTLRAGVQRAGAGALG